MHSEVSTRFILLYNQEWRDPEIACFHIIEYFHSISTDSWNFFGFLQQ